MIQSDIELIESLELSDEDAALFQRLSAPDTKCGKLQRAVLALILGDRHFKGGAIPTSIRFLFYELIQRIVLGYFLPKHYDEYVDKHGKTKTPKRKPSQDVSDALTVLRELGIVPWKWIKDERRRLSTWLSALNVDGWLIDSLGNFRLNPWGNEPPPLILTESKSLAGVLEDLAMEYLCPIAATGGQVGGFLHTDVIPAIQELHLQHARALLRRPGFGRPSD